MKKVFNEQIFQVVTHFLYIKEMVVLNLSWKLSFTNCFSTHQSQDRQRYKGKA
jgi:hypothetical protein